MSILTIARLGNPILREVAEPLTTEEISSPELQSFIDDLLETVKNASGAGLAAPQVSISKRIIVIRLYEDFEIWINPIIEHTSQTLQLTFEGCLSVPDLRAAVARSLTVKVTGLNRLGEPFEHYLEGRKSVVAQHELDHLDGIIYVDRAEPGTLCFLDEFKNHQEEILNFAFPEELSSEE
jgi:peptide deformylase